MTVERLITAALLSIFCISLATGQNQPEHKKKTFKDENGVIYWNKELPFYVNLSTDPNGSEGITLQTDEKPEKVEAQYFDTEGINWIRTRWKVNSETREYIYPQQEVMWPVNADGLAPETKATFNYAGKHVSNGKVYYSGDLTIDLNADDEVSGVDKTFYSLGDTYKEYNNSIKPDTEKNWKLSFYSVDRVGNIESPNSTDKTSYNFVIDKTAPTSTHATTGPKSNNILSPKAKVSLSSTDEGAGLDNIYYTVDGGSEKQYSYDLPLSTLSEGDHTITYYGIDEVTNKETVNTFSFYIDRTAPEVAFEVTGDNYSNKSNQLFVSERSSIVLKGTDNKSGVSKVYYKLDNGAYGEYSTSIKTTQTPGVHGVSYYGIDLVENQSAAKRNTYIIDTKAPVIKYNIHGPKYERRDTLFVRDITEFSITPYESGVNQSGVKAIKYRDNGSADKNYEKRFAITGNGNHKFEIDVYDNVNNKSSQVKALFVDNTAPEIHSHFSVDEIGSKTVRKEKYTIYPSEVQLYLAATDANVGTDKIYYSINGGTEKLYGSPISNFKVNKNIEVSVRTIDLLGNESKSTIKFSVEE